MNTDGLKKLYDRLLPEERNALILAATVRGDATEVDRLVRTAPRVAYSVPHHYPQLEAFQSVALVHLAQMLQGSSAYWQAVAHSIDGAGFTGKKMQKRLDEVVRVRAYLLVTYLRGWEEFCEGLKIPADILRAFLPEWASMEKTLVSARAMAFNVAQVVRWLAMSERSKDRESSTPPDVVTVGDVVEGLRKAMKMQAETWQ
jgi:hypothetical protein